ncbi:glycosyltransferase family 39 protein [bacterium]|nr:glycosyltransferase family 39 protein [bacterium]
MWWREKSKALTFIFILAALLRVFFAFAYGNKLRYSDSLQYMEFAQNLSQEGEFRATQKDGLAVRAYRPPAYPLTIYLLGNIPHSFTWVKIFQILLSLLSIFLIYEILDNSLGRKGAFLGALIWAVFPSSIYYTSAILTECTFSAYLILGTYFLLTFKKKEDSVIAVIFSGLFFAMAALTKSFAFFLPLFIIIGALIFKFASFKKTAVMTAAFILFTLPWGIRNMIVLDHYTPVSTEGGISLYWENHEGAVTGKGYTQPEKFDLEAFSNMDEIGRSKYYSKLAVKQIISHPFLFFKRAAGRIWELLKPMPRAGLSGGFAPAEFLFRIGYGVIYLPVIILFLLSLSSIRKEPLIAFSFVIFIFFLLVYGLVAGKTRYRMPLEPFLIISATAYLTRYCKWGKNES